MRYAAAALLVLYSGCISPATALRDMPPKQGIERFVSSMRAYRDIEWTLRPGEEAHALFHIDCEDKSKKIQSLYTFNTELIARLTELKYAPVASLVFAQQVERAAQPPYSESIDLGRLACGVSVNLVMNTMVANHRKLRHADLSEFLRTQEIDALFAELPKVTDTELRQLASAIVRKIYLRPGLSPAESFLQVPKVQELE